MEDSAAHAGQGAREGAPVSVLSIDARAQLAAQWFRLTPKEVRAMRLGLFFSLKNGTSTSLCSLCMRFVSEVTGVPYVWMTTWPQDTLVGLLCAALYEVPPGGSWMYQQRWLSVVSEYGDNLREHRRRMERVELAVCTRAIAAVLYVHMQYGAILLSAVSEHGSPVSYSEYETRLARIAAEHGVRALRTPVSQLNPLLRSLVRSTEYLGGKVEPSDFGQHVASFIQEIMEWQRSEAPPGTDRVLSR